MLAMRQKRPRPLVSSPRSLVISVLVACLGVTAAFAPVFNSHKKVTGARLFALPSVDSMKAGEMKKELESYGISTKSFFEKSEFADALKKARSEGKTPKAKTKSSQQKSSTSSGGASKSREDRIKEEMDKAKKMKVSELKTELKKYGVSTKSFFEKSEFVKALAEAIVDGKQGVGGSKDVQEEEYDPSYRDVTMQKYVPNPRDFSGGPIIDVRLR